MKPPFFRRPSARSACKVPSASRRPADIPPEFHFCGGTARLAAPSATARHAPSACRTILPKTQTRRAAARPAAPFPCPDNPRPPDRKTTCAYTWPLQRTQNDSLPIPEDPCSRQSPPRASTPMDPSCHPVSSGRAASDSHQNPEALHDAPQWQTPPEYLPAEAPPACPPWNDPPCRHAPGRAAASAPPRCTCQCREEAQPEPLPAANQYPGQTSPHAEQRLPDAPSAPESSRPPACASQTFSAPSVRLPIQ